MTATFQEANDEVLAVFKAAWDTTGFIAVYENVRGDKPTTTAPWARASLRNVTGRQATLANHDGVRRWRRDGILTIQIFVPLGEGLQEGYSLSKVVTDALEGTSTPSAVWFRNVSVNEIGPDGEWFQFNVLAEFTYDEVK